MRAKTPEQLRLLGEMFDAEPFPYPGDLILLTWQTGLRPEQVKGWFEHKRSQYLRRGRSGREERRRMSDSVT